MKKRTPSKWFLAIVLMSVFYTLNAQCPLVSKSHVLSEQEVLVKRIAQAHFAANLQNNAKVYKIAKQKRTLNFYNNLIVLRKNLGNLEEYNLALDKLEFDFNDFERHLTLAHTEADLLKIVDLVNVLDNDINNLYRLLKAASPECMKDAEPSIEGLKWAKMNSEQNVMAQQAILYYVLMQVKSEDNSTMMLALTKTIIACEQAMLEMGAETEVSDKQKALLKKFRAHWMKAEDIITNTQKELRKDSFKLIMEISDDMNAIFEQQQKDYEAIISKGIQELVHK